MDKESFWLNALNPLRKIIRLFAL